MIGIRSMLLAGLAVSALAACSDPKFDDSSQFGSNPVLPEPKQFLVPPINVVPGPGWEKGHTPDVADGLEVRPLATGLSAGPCGPSPNNMLAATSSAVKNTSRATGENTSQRCQLGAWMGVTKARR